MVRSVIIIETVGCIYLFIICCRLGRFWFSLALYIVKFHVSDIDIRQKVVRMWC